MKMTNQCLAPPLTVKNMTVLDRNAFVKVVSVPSLSIDKKHFDKIMKRLKPYVLKLLKFNSVLIPAENSDLRQILLNPELITNEAELRLKLGEDFKVEHYSLMDVTINYENWKANDILEAVLPDNDSGCSGYSIVGHILQLNLREHLLPFKHLIAQVYNDKVSNITMVVNKLDIIDNSDNTFRSFLMEKLAGDSDTTITTVKENNCRFTFDFAKVYWNSRLSTEHERIVKKLNKGDVLFDIMAGVGPFSVPAAKKNCQVYANDLNPASYEALKNNCVINKVEKYVECHQMDGKDFIKTIFKEKFPELLTNPTFIGSVHIIMNLPSIAISFLPYFKDLYENGSTLKFQSNLENISKLPIMHVYLFSNNETPEFALYLVASKLGYIIKEIDVSGDVREISVEQVNEIIDSNFKKYIIEIVNVRRVAPAKVMFRVSFHLPKEIFINISVLCHSSKKLKV